MVLIETNLSLQILIVFIRHCLNMFNVLKVKNSLFKRTKYWLLSFKKLQNCFLGRFLWSNFDLNRFEAFASLSQKTVSTLSLKNLQKKLKSAICKRSEHSYFNSRDCKILLNIINKLQTWNRLMFSSLNCNFFFITAYWSISLKSTVPLPKR